MTEPDTRTQPPTAGTEAETLLGFLVFHRDTLRHKAGGLSRAQLGQRLKPSTMTLGGMIKHLAFVEDYWLSHMLLGNEPAEPWAGADWEADPDWDWTSAAEDSTESLRELYEGTVARSDEILRVTLASGDLDRWTIKPGRGGRPFSLRWVLLHLIEEYARHNGHADLIRESIDGRTGE